MASGPFDVIIGGDTFGLALAQDLMRPHHRLAYRTSRWT